MCCIEKDKIELSWIGEIVRQEFLHTFEMRKNIQLDEWVIMPNHIHAVIVVNKTFWHDMRYGCQNVGRDGLQTVPTKNGKPIIPQPQEGSISIPIRNFKSMVTKRCRASGYRKKIWQPRYHDRIIRNESELFIRRRYVRNNPKNWRRDRNKAPHMI